MGYALCFSTCARCGQIFGFNPHLVPSVRATPDGPRLPLCEACVRWANPRRKAKGLAEIEVRPGAYRPLEEKDL
jgi:hypothetical protein